MVFLCTYWSISLNIHIPLKYIFLFCYLISRCLSHHKLKFWTGIRQKIRCGMVYIGWYGFIGPITSTTDISLTARLSRCITLLLTRCIQGQSRTYQPLKWQSGLQGTTNFAASFPVFDKNKVWYFMRIACQQTILVKYRALYVIFEKAAKFENVKCKL